MPLLSFIRIGRWFSSSKGGLKTSSTCHNDYGIYNTGLLCLKSTYSLKNEQFTSNSTLEQTHNSLCLVWDRHKLTQYFIRMVQ